MRELFALACPRPPSVPRYASQERLSRPLVVRQASSRRARCLSAPRRWGSGRSRPRHDVSATATHAGKHALQRNSRWSSPHWDFGADGSTLQSIKRLPAHHACMSTVAPGCNDISVVTPDPVASAKPHNSSNQSRPLAEGHPLLPGRGLLFLGPCSSFPSHHALHPHAVTMACQPPLQ